MLILGVRLLWFRKKADTRERGMMGREQETQRLQELGDFLRTRRARLAPEDVGMPRGKGTQPEKRARFTKVHCLLLPSCSHLSCRTTPSSQPALHTGFKTRQVLVGRGVPILLWHSSVSPSTNPTHAQKERNSEAKGIQNRLPCQRKARR